MTWLLKGDEIKNFQQVTKIIADKIYISKEKNNYYAIIIKNDIIKIKIGDREEEKKLLEKLNIN